MSSVLIVLTAARLWSQRDGSQRPASSGAAAAEAILETLSA
jgi:hypothetical protein